MKAKHTAGPFEAWAEGDEIRGGDCHQIVALVDGIPVVIADVPIRSENGVDDQPTYIVSEDESLANLALLAAAPELERHFELLLELSDKNDYETYRKAVQEIAKSALSLARNE